MEVYVYANKKLKINCLTLVGKGITIWLYTLMVGNVIPLNPNL